MTHLNGTPADDPTIGSQVIAKGIVFEVLEAVQDNDGVLLAVRRPKGTKVYCARFWGDNTKYGDRWTTILCPL